MKRWQWVSLVVLAGLTAAVVAVLPFRSDGNTSRTLAQQQPRLELDMVQDDGDTWCDPVQNTTTHSTAEGEYQVAVCLTNAPDPPGAFQFDIVYDQQLNDCVDDPVPPASAFDGNPDANLGATTFDGTTPVSANGLGTGWDCNLSGITPPLCSNLQGHAFLQCNTIIGTTQLPVGQGVSEPIAVVTFDAIAGGTDNLTIEQAEVDGPAGAYVDCFAVPPAAGLCMGAEDEKTGELPPTSTSTATPGTPTATREVCGVDQRVTCTPTPRVKTATPTEGPTETPLPPTEQPPPPPPPPAGGGAPTVIPPTTGEGSGMPWGVPVAAVIIGIVAISLISSGLYVRFARNR